MTKQTKPARIRVLHRRYTFRAYTTPRLETVSGGIVVVVVVVVVVLVGVVVVHVGTCVTVPATRLRRDK